MKNGELFIITTGEYSDFGIYAKLVALRDFSFDDELERYLTLNSGQRKEYRFDEAKFLTWLTSEGFVQEAEIREVYLSAYSTPEKSPAGDSLRTTDAQPKDKT